MRSKEQEELIEKKVKATVTLFLKTRLSNIELADILNKEEDFIISSSAVQRYLNDEKTIIHLFDQETYDLVQELIKANKENALSKGGFNSSINNTQLKDDEGRYIGNIPIDSNYGANLKK